MPTEQYALEALSVSHRYHRRGPWVLRDVSLEIPAGSITALVGPNGAGKSTLIRSWIGFERPTQGVVRVCGVGPLADPMHAIRKVGYVSQSTGLYRGLRVVDHLELAESLRPDFDSETARARLAQLRIPLDRRAGQLSGGQQAHVALAIALGTKAPVMLLDEPLAALDPLARHEFLSVLVEDVRHRNGTVLMSSHILSDIEIACDAIVVLGDGTLLMHGGVQEAIAAHRIAASDGDQRPGLVAHFRRPGGAESVLLRSSDPDLSPPSLEELVMGYLAAVGGPQSATDRRW